MRKYHKWINVRVGEEFFKACQEHPAFQKEPKTIIPAFTWLNFLSSAIACNDGLPVTYYHEDIKDRFKPYSNTAYKVFVNALKELGFLMVNDFYIRSTNKTGQCKKYFISTKCYRLLQTANLEWFKKLHTDKLLIRQTQKTISKSKVVHRQYDDAELQVVHQLLLNLEFNYEAVLKQLSDTINTSSPDTLPTTLHYGGDNRDNPSIIRSINAVLNLLITIKTKDFALLRKNATDNRVWNEFTALKSGYRKFFRYKNLRYVNALDMRSCHFAFLGLFISQLYEAHKQTPLDLAPFMSIIKTVKLVRNPINPRWRKIKQIMIKTINNPNDSHLAIAADLAKWNELFSGEEDPRIKIATLCGWTVEKTKQNINAWLNGSKQFKKLDQWLEKEFPAFAMVWQSLDGNKKKIVGNSIADAYETPIFLDIDLYKHASDVGLKLSYEYDGVGIFADPNDPELENKIDSVEKYLQGRIADVMGIENGKHLTKRK